MDLAVAQSELRHSYVNGGPGTIVSGLVWLLAGITASTYGISTGFVVLFFGGMLIFPTSLLIVRACFRRPHESKNSPCTQAVIETIVPMLGGLLAAWLLIPYRPECVFPIAAIAVGAHYFGFRTAYGDITFWVLAVIMCAVGSVAIFTHMLTPNTVPFLIAAVEVLFGIYLTWTSLSANDE